MKRSTKDVFWAPGEKIPVEPKPGKPEARAGTTYAAALAAGVVARILAEHPKIESKRLLDTLRETSRPAKAGGPAILNLEGALAALRPDAQRGSRSRPQAVFL